jgi:biotin transport system substrate-specific component
VAFLSPTAGYLLAFLPAAFFVGLYSEKFKNSFHLFIAGIIGIIIIYLGGTSWLTIYLNDISKAWRAGAAPFMLIDLIKTSIAVIIYRSYLSLKKEGSS